MRHALPLRGCYHALPLKSGCVAVSDRKCLSSLAWRPLIGSQCFQGAVVVPGRFHEKGAAASIGDQTGRDTIGVD